ncbi:hypothetical protein EJ08DRAFT_417790 [Tothia fuscella]|uniref:Uncharacterized protein n=1 Tax=Tothia fuscella TaxID=1048955 RepID=A0A9P4TV46_9PEZI|nr:hypothetical protein EJ08DRAFT_417790 [Tothia fuscella]
MSTFPKRSRSTAADMMDRETEPDPKRLKVNTAPSIGPPKGAPLGPAASTSSARSAAPTRSVTTDNHNREPYLLGRREYPDDPDAVRRRDSDTSAFVGLHPGRVQGTGNAERSPGSGANSPAMRSPGVRSPAVQSPSMQSPRMHNIPLNRERSGYVSNSPIAPTALVNQEKSAVTQGPSVPQSPLAQSTIRRSPIAQIKKDLIANDLLAPANAIERMLLTNTRATLSLFKQDQLNIRLQARKAELVAVEKYERGTKTFDDRRKAVEKAKEEVETNVISVQQLLEGQKKQAAAIAELMSPSAAGKEGETNTVTVANEKISLLQKQLDLMNTSFDNKLEMQLSNFEKKIRTELNQKDKKIAELEFSVATAVEAVQQARDALNTSSAGISDLRNKVSLEAQARQSVSVAVINEKTKRTGQTEPQLEKHGKTILNLEGEIRDIHKRMDILVGSGPKSDKPDLLEKHDREISIIYKDISSLIKKEKDLYAKVESLTKQGKRLQNDLDGEKKERVTIIDEDIKKLYNRVSQHKVDNENLKSTDSKLDARVFKLEELTKDFNELEAKRREESTTNANKIASLTSKVSVLNARQNPNPATSTKGLSSPPDILALVKAEIEAEMERHGDTWVQATLKLTEDVIGERLVTAKSGGGDNESLSIEVKGQLDAVCSRLEEVEHTLSGESMDDTDPGCIVHLVINQSKWIDDSKPKFNKLHEEVVVAKEQLNNLKPFDARITALESTTVNNVMLEDRVHALEVKGIAEARQSRDDSVTSNASASAPCAPDATQVKKIKNAVKELQGGYKTALASLASFESQLAENKVAEEGQKKDLEKGLAETFDLINDRFNIFSDRVGLVEDKLVQPGPRTKESWSPEAGNQRPVQESVTTQQQVQRLEKQVERLEKRSPPLRSEGQSRETIEALTKFSQAITNLENGQAALRAESVTGLVRTNSLAIASLEQRYQNLMTNDLAGHILNQLRQQHSSLLDPAVISTRFQQQDNAIGRLGQWQSNNKYGHRLTAVENKVAAISPTPLTTTDIDTAVDRLGGSASAKSGSEIQGGPVEAPLTIESQVDTLRKSLYMLIRQLNLEAYFNVDGTVTEPPTILSAEFEKQITTLVERLNVLTENAKNSDQQLKALIDDVHAANDTLDTLGGSISNTTHELLDVKNKCVKKKDFEEVRTTVRKMNSGVLGGGKVVFNGTNGVRSSSKHAISDLEDSQDDMALAEGVRRSLTARASGSGSGTPISRTKF